MTAVPEPGAGIVGGSKFTVTPLGAPEAVSVTGPLKPLSTVVVTVDVS
jgi:hypothetical protein